MPFVKSSALSAHASQLRRLNAENADLRAQLGAREQQLRDVQRELAEAKRPKPAPQFTEVTRELRGFLPMLPASPAWPALTAANDAKSYAIALNSLVQHVRLAAANEARRRG